MNLHVDQQGSGEPLLLIPGWGMHGGVWSDVAKRLASDFQVHSVDLPGYGFSLPLPNTDLDTLVQELSEQYLEPVFVCGWSLGGQVALRWAAREPEKIRRLILVSSTPCFTEREDWLFGMDTEVLERFATGLEQSFASTLRRFVTLQLRGSENERNLLVLLREKLFSRGEPDINTLRDGLSMLRDADQRSELPHVKQPTLLISGDRDRLTPPEASYYMAQVIPNARMEEVTGAAHAPFLSHPDIFVEQVKRFLHERI